MSRCVEQKKAGFNRNTPLSASTVSYKQSAYLSRHIKSKQFSSHGVDLIIAGRATVFFHFLNSELTRGCDVGSDGEGDGLACPNVKWIRPS
jgi:hypothetical protein